MYAFRYYGDLVYCDDLNILTLCIAIVINNAIIDSQIHQISLHPIFVL